MLIRNPHSGLWTNIGGWQSDGWGRVATASGVVFDAVSNPAPILSSGSSPLSWTHTPVGVPTAVAVLMGGFNSSIKPTAVTYGGVSMTLGTAFGPDQPFVIIAGLANPSSGAQTVSISGFTSCFLAAAAITVTGSDTTTCFRNSTGLGRQTDGGSGSSVSVSSAVGDLVIDCVVGFSMGSAPSGSSGNSAAAHGYTVTWNGNLGFGVATSAGAATTTATWTNPDNGAGQLWSGAIASFQHA
jgi:hypothetical protein